jgi:hypothetical protein
MSEQAELYKKKAAECERQAVLVVETAIRASVWPQDFSDPWELLT